MPSSIKIDAEKLLRKLKTLHELAPVTGALLAAGAHVAGKFSEYPPQSGLTRKQVYGQSFQSERQRRWFFAALSRGEIDVPYRRGSSAGSRNLKQTWTVRQISPLAVVSGPPRLGRPVLRLPSGKLSVTPRFTRQAILPVLTFTA